MNPLGKTIKKPSKRSTSQKRASETAPLPSQMPPDAVETSPVTPESKSKRQHEPSTSVSRPRRRLDFSKLDIRAIAASASNDTFVSSIGALTKTIEDICKCGKASGWVSVSLLVVSTRVRTTKGGSKYFLFVDDTGFLSLCVSSKTAAVAQSETETTSKDTAKTNAFTVRIQGKVNYQPSTSNNEETFMALDWNAKVEAIPVAFGAHNQLHVPVSIHALSFTLSFDRHVGLGCPILLADFVTAQVDHTKKEVTMSLLDCTGYAFINVTNAPSTLGVDAEDGEDLGPVLIAGAITFKTVETMIVDGIAATVDFNKCYIQPVNGGILKIHNERIAAVPKENFQFDEPLLTL